MHSPDLIPIRRSDAQSRLWIGFKSSSLLIRGKAQATKNCPKIWSNNTKTYRVNFRTFYADSQQTIWDLMWDPTTITVPDSLCDPLWWIRVSCECYTYTVNSPVGQSEKILKYQRSEFKQFLSLVHIQDKEIIVLVAWEVQQLILSKHVLCDCVNFRSACRSRPVFFSRKLRLCQGKSTDH